MPYPETIKYIKKQLDNGFSSDKIKKALQDSGYGENVIDQLMKQAGVGDQKTQNKTGIENILKDIGIGVVLLLIIGSLVYFNFFNDKDKEMYSPAQLSKDVKLDLSIISPLQLKKDGHVIIDLTNHVKDESYKISQMKWSNLGKRCVNIQFTGNQAIIRSIFLPKCPTTETISLTVTNPYGNSDSDEIVINII
jgi:DNA-binding transcriptional MerR regulator